jgi:ribosomal protein L14E/L6E/L27E
LIGRLVYSVAGRDKDKAFVVLRVEPQGYLAVADGDIRKIEQPKIKNPKHVRMTDLVLPEIRNMLLQGEQPANHMIRNSIRQLLET